MRVYFSTIVRNAPVAQGGEVVGMDWESRQVFARVPITPTEPFPIDPNPRGNSRGGRGIAVLGQQVVVAGYDVLRVFDRDLEYQFEISHPLMVGIHELFTEPGDQGLWVTSTSIDAALKFDLASGELLEQIWPREIPAFQQALQVMPLEIDKQVDNRRNFLSSEHVQDPSHLHLNALASWQGELYALFHAQGVIANLTQEKVFIRDACLKKGHNLHIWQDGTAVVNDTYRRAVCFYDLRTGQLKHAVNLTDFPAVTGLVNWSDQLEYFAHRVTYKLGFKNLLPSARPLFVRGLAAWDRFVLVGVSPAALVLLDWVSAEVLEVFPFGMKTCVAVHGLHVLPDES